jgi:hypothetical protein
MTAPSIDAVSGLVRELRGLAKAHALGSAFFDKENARTCSSAADALEAQARELAEARSDLDAAYLRQNDILIERDTAEARIAALEDAVRVKDEAHLGAMAALAAAISLLERTPKAKKAAPSDRMFDLMLDDYRKALDAARTALSNGEPND